MALRSYGLFPSQPDLRTHASLLDFTAPLEPTVRDLRGEGGLPPAPVRQALFPGPHTCPHSQAISRLRRFSVSSWVMDINCSILILEQTNPPMYSADVTLPTGSPASFRKSSLMWPPRQAPAASCTSTGPVYLRSCRQSFLHKEMNIPFGKWAKDTNGHFTDA